MKKILLMLFLVVFVFSVNACQKEEIREEENNVVKSSSNETSLSKDDIIDALDKLWIDTFAGGKSAVPDALSAEKVKLLASDNYASSKKEFDNYCSKAEKRLESFLSELPDRCVVQAERETGNFSSVYEVTTFYILDPASVSDSDREALKNYLGSRVDSIIEGEEYISTETDKQFEEIGTVVVHHRGLRWYWFDTATNEAEPVELFLDYTKVKQMYLDFMKTSVTQEYEAAIRESAE